MGATLHRGARASHHCDLSCCGAQAPDAQAQQLWLTGLVAPRHVGSSQTRARTRVSCISRQTLNHCATREALSFVFDRHFSLLQAMLLRTFLYQLLHTYRSIFIPRNGNVKSWITHNFTFKGHYQIVMHGIDSANLLCHLADISLCFSAISAPLRFRWDNVTSSSQ